MRPTPRPRLLRHDLDGAEETFQVVPALTVAVLCVSLVLAAVGSATQAASQSWATGRAALQAELLLDSLRETSVLRNHGGPVCTERARMVAQGAIDLPFEPSTTRIISLVWFPNGTEFFLVGNASRLSERLMLRAHPVAVQLESGEVRPGLLRVGVEVR